MAELEIPSYFLCPISLQIMQDPVTLSTGITYDRKSIESWIFTGKHSKCPVTNQSLINHDLTPNHTLRRLIQSWCVTNASHGVERVPTPRAPVDQATIVKILNNAKSPHSQLSCLQKLKSIALESERNRSCVENSPAVDFLASVVINGGNDAVVDEALCILNSLRVSDHGLINLVSRNGDNFIDSLAKILQFSSILSSRTNAVILLKSIVPVIAPARLVATSKDAFAAIVKILRDTISLQTTKAALETLIGLCPWGRNRIKAVGAGTVHVLIEMLMGEQERRVTEMVLVLLDKLCGCAEGRAEVVGHAAGIAAVGKSILRVSAAAENERAVRVLWSVSRSSATAAVLQEMVQVGVVQKLCMMMAVGDCGSKAKERAGEILRMHARVWRESRCLSPQLQALYPC